MASPGRTTGDKAEGAEAAARLLADRARTLAAPPPPPGEESVAVVAFQAGEERFAVTLEAVLRIERVETSARVPGAPPEVLGVIAVDGRPCPLVEVPALLGAAGSPGPARRWAVILGRRIPEVALAADAVDLVVVARAGLSGGGPRLGVTADARQVLSSAALLDPQPGGGDPP